MIVIVTPRPAIVTSARRSARSGRKYGVLMRTVWSAPSIRSCIVTRDAVATEASS
jgi:hypothetical protein